MENNKKREILMLAAGILFFIASYRLDAQVSALFKDFRLPFLDFTLSIITNFGLVVAAMLVIPSIASYKKNRKFVYLLWLTFIVSFAFAFVVKLVVLRQRPAVTLTYPLINLVDYSFPSMHAMVAFSLLPLLARHMPRQKYFWMSFAFLVAFSRIYFRFHYLSDVVFGIFAGYFIGLFLLKQFNKIQ